MIMPTLVRMHDIRTHPNKLIRRSLRLIDKRVKQLESKVLLNEEDADWVLATTAKLIPLSQAALELEKAALAIFERLDHKKVYDAIKGLLPTGEMGEAAGVRRPRGGRLKKKNANRPGQGTDHEPG